MANDILQNTHARRQLPGQSHGGEPCLKPEFATAVGFLSFKVSCLGHSAWWSVYSLLVLPAAAGPVARGGRAWPHPLGPQEHLREKGEGLTGSEELVG